MGQTDREGVIMTGSPFTQDMQTTIVLDELDADRILRFLYNGHRPERVHTLICLCGTLADLREDPRAWNGWRILPNAVCPECLAAGNFRKAEEIAALYPSEAYDRYIKMLSEVLLARARGR
jgi:hypothetical protein